MSANTVTATPLAFVNLNGGLKMALVTVTGTASYDTGGSAIDLSTSGNLGVAAGFQTVLGAMEADNTTAGSSKYQYKFLHAASNAAATGKLKVHDLSAASDAEVSSTTDLSGTVFRLLVIGT